MRLWFLRRVDQNTGYDEAEAFVVRASTEASARSFAADQCGDEGESVWTDPAGSVCKALTHEGPPSVILRDFNAG